MKIIFLDFDGVLNDSIHLQTHHHDWIEMIDPEKVKLLNKIVEETQAVFVVSSTWRMGNSLDDLQGFLEHHGFKGKLIGKTPHKNSNRVRGIEIQKWLSDNEKDVEAFVILDDEKDMAHLEDYLIKTSFFPLKDQKRGGLLPEHVSLVISRLKGKQNAETNS